MKYYAGIGNRDISTSVQESLVSCANYLSENGYIVRSGGAQGADYAFEIGSKESVILKPKDATSEAIELASRYHPAWDKCNEYVRKLHGRNAMIILGKHLDSPVDFVLCFAKNECTGGTALGIRIARDYKIPVINLYSVL